MILTWWEVEELEEHLHGRDDIWTWDETYKMWLRTNNAGDALLGLKILGPNSVGPYRKFMLKHVPLGWDDSACTDYILQLCTKWTSYGFRSAVQELLTTDDGIKMDPSLAEAVAVAIAKLEQEPAPDPEKLELPTQGEIWPDMTGPELVPSTVERTVRMLALNGGGWVSIRYQGEMLRVRMSVPSASHDGYPSWAFEGYIRPRSGNIAIACGDLFGHELPAKLRPTLGSVPEGDPIRPSSSSQGDLHDALREDRDLGIDPGAAEVGGSTSPASDQGSPAERHGGSGDDARPAEDPGSQDVDPVLS